MSSKTTWGKVASTAGRTLASSGASSLQKSLAGSALSQSGNQKVTSKQMETKASAALQSDRSSSTTMSLACSLVSQSKKNP
jgi:type IV secretory pathway TrbL component